MRRFGLILTDSQYEEFYRSFPGHGARTTVLRRCVNQLVKRARLAGRTWDDDAVEIADEVMNRLEGK